MPSKNRLKTYVKGAYYHMLVQNRTEQQYTTAISYIHQNPKDGPPTRIEYPYSSEQYYLKGQGPSWLKIDIPHPNM